MKALVLTPIYYIKERNNLFHDTSAVHYLLKFWPEDAEIVVVHEYHSSPKQLIRFSKKEERILFKEGYHFKEDGIDVHMYELPIMPHQKELFFIQKKYMAKRINNLLSELNFDPDVIICHMPCYYISQYIDRIEVKNRLKIGVLHYSDCKELSRNPRYKETLEKNFDYILSRSVAIRETFRKINLKNLCEECVPSGVPQSATEIERSWNNNPMSILYVGKMIKRKHIDLIIKALHNINTDRTFKLTIIGIGSEEKNLKKLVKEYHMEEVVEFLTYLPRKKVIELMGKSDIFVMPSTEETLGLVYLEAMQQGCITIGTKGEGIDGIIDDKVNGFLVKPRDIVSLQDVLERILNMNSDELKMISREAKKTGELYSEEKIGLNYFYVIKEYVDNYINEKFGKLDILKK